VATEIYAPPAGSPEKVPRKQQLLADGALVGLTVIWGTSFVMVKDVLEQVPTMVFLATRFALGSLALALIAAALGRLRGLTWRELQWGTLIGLVLWTGYILQTTGLGLTSASNGGFITGLSVVLVPLFGVPVLKQKPHRWALAGVVMATVGLMLLSLKLEEGIRVNQGDVLVFGCAIAFAIHIVLIARAAGWVDPLRLALVQVVVAGLLNALTALLFERPVPGLGPEIWAATAYLGIFGTALAIAIQIGVQRFTTAVHTALIFTLEPVFAALFGVWLQGDVFGPVGILGAVLILAGMLVAELGPMLPGRLAQARREA
jgi:drug/metabolite transporter (DMT)-like permease